MFLDASRFPCAGLLERNFEIIRAEARSIPLELFEPWLLRDAYEGDWRVFGLHHQRDGFVLASHLLEERRSRYCERTRALLRRLPGLFAAGVSWVGPGCHIHPHTDEQTVRTVRCHLGLQVHPRARLRVKTEARAWELGRCFVFDSGDEHEAFNESTGPRVAFIVELELARAKEALLPEAREATAGERGDRGA